MEIASQSVDFITFEGSLKNWWISLICDSIEVQMTSSQLFDTPSNCNPRALFTNFSILTNSPTLKEESRSECQLEPSESHEFTGKELFCVKYLHFCIHFVLQSRGMLVHLRENCVKWIWVDSKTKKINMKFKI